MAPLARCRLFKDNMTDFLQKAAESYLAICKNHYHFTLSNGETIHLVFKPQNFAHLAVLRKLDDLYELRSEVSATNLFKQILRGQITLLDVQRSIHFDTDAYARIENLCRLDYFL